MRQFAALCAVIACVSTAFGATEAGAAGCPNEALRIGPSAQLPGCRGYEMVSPIAKSGGNISPVLGVHAAPDGGAVSFTSSTPFAGAPGSPTMNTYIGRRGANWGTEAVDPPQFNHGMLVIGASATSSRDLGKTLGASTLALTPGAIEGGSNIYLRDNATGNLTLVTATPGGSLFMAFTGVGGGSFLDATPSLSHILLESSREALPVTSGPSGPETGNHLYEYGEGQLRLVDVLPDGTVPAGSNIGDTSTPYQHLVSTDGSRVFFQASGFGEGPLYMRVDGTSTVPISASRRAADAGEPEPKSAEFGVASADGSIVYFTSHSPLLEGPEAATGTSHRKLYRYDTNTGSLEEVVPAGPEGTEVDKVLGASEDGSYVYFSSPEALAEGATEVAGTGNFYVAHEGTVKWIGQTSAADYFESSFPNQWSISPDGRHFALAGYSPMTEEDVPSPSNCPTDPTANNQAGDCLDVYSFEYESGRLVCLSCDGPGKGDSELGGQEFHEQGYGDWAAHSVLDNGTVYFDTPNRLLPRDGNGVGDVYAWREGAYQLISTGSGVQPSSFGDATSDGSNVFFLTSQALVKQDTDQIIDVYDNREFGGLSDQWPPGLPGACEEQGCRGAAPTAPAGLPSGSSVAAPAPVSCASLKAASGAAQRKAQRLGRRAKKAAKGRGTAAKARSRRLHRQAGVARKQVKRLQKEVAKCGRASR
jgi:hypothetical protein